VTYVTGAGPPLRIRRTFGRYNTSVLSRAANPSGDPALGATRLEIGTVVRVESAAGETWSGRVTSVSDQHVGLRGYMNVNGQFRMRDRVTVHVGRANSLVSIRAQVLAAEGTLLRVVRRDASIEQERRRAPRLRIELDAVLTVAMEADAAPERLAADLIDLSSSGCALRSDLALRVGAPVRIGVTLGGADLELAGVVVRTWVEDGSSSPHAGVQFDTMPAPTVRVLNRFLVEQLRTV
jgi:hypothetical protein